jgi:acetyl-CoA acyltransferase
MKPNESQLPRVAVISGVRTPFVKSGTAFKKMGPNALGGVAIRETMARSGVDPKLVEEVYFGIVSAPAEGTNVSREALFDSGLPASIPCTTVNRYCASSAEAASVIVSKIQSGQIEVGIAGGVESISSIRALFGQEATDHFQNLGRAKTFGQKLAWLKNFKASYLTPHAPGIKEPTTGLTMGQSADLMTRKFKITRQAQDQFAYESHKKAAAAWANGFFSTHVVSVATPDGKICDRDNNVRDDTTVEKLSELRPVFYKDGSITAGNASPLTDGASAALLMSESKAKELGVKPLGFIKGFGVAAVDIQKEPLLIGPVYAIPKALKAAGIQWNDLDLIEIHEAFAGQVLSTIAAIESKEFCKEKLGMDSAIGNVDRTKVNINGGSIPLGHPFGATGTRLILQTLHQLKMRNQKLGLISICAAGGLGLVVIVEAA